MHKKIVTLSIIFIAVMSGSVSAEAYSGFSCPDYPKKVYYCHQGQGWNTQYLVSASEIPRAMHRSSECTKTSAVSFGMHKLQAGPNVYWATSGAVTGPNEFCRNPVFYP